MDEFNEIFVQFLRFLEPFVFYRMYLFVLSSNKALKKYTCFTADKKRKGQRRSKTLGEVIKNHRIEM